MDGFDDFFKQQGAAPAATPVDKPASEFDDFFQFQREQQQQRATDALNGAIGAKPDQVGKAMTVAPQVGMPSQAVETDIPSFEDQLQMTRAVKRVEANPVLGRWLAGDADRARVAIDDFDNLDMVSQAFQALGSGWEEGVLTNARARAQFEQSTLGTDRQSELSAYDKRMARNPSLRGLYGTLQAGAGFAGGILDSIVRASDEAVFGAGVGAIAGAAATAPAGGVGAVPGAITGFGVGAVQGFFVDQSLVAAGMTYQALENAVDDGGRPVDPVAKHTAAAGVFLAAYALNYVGGEVIWGSAQKALQAVAVEAVKKPTVARALTSFGKELAKGGIEGAALMGAFAATQVFAENFAKQYSSDDFATIFNNSEARVQAADQLVQAMTMGAVFMPFVKLPFEIKTLAHDMTRARQAQNDAAIMQALGEAIGASKVRTRNMDAFQAFAAEHLKGGPIEEVGVPVEAVVELYQSLKIEPGADDGVLGPVAKDIAKQIEQAKETGGDIRLNLDAYTAKLAGSEIWNALSGEIRFRPEGMTLREADHYAKMRGQLLEDNAVEFNKAMDAAAKSEEGAAAVYEDVFSKLRRAGYTVDAATQVATLWSSRYRARAERLGDTDALELYDNENITIRRELPPTVRRVGVDRTDMLIEAIRRGEKLPSDRRIYGPSLIEQIKKMGGVFDYGGEFKARDLHKMRGFVRTAKKGGDKEVYGMDGVTRALWEMGYFPEHQERPEINDLLAAIDDELAGSKRYQYGTDREAEALFKKAVEELDDFLGQNDIDVKKTSNAKIKKLLIERSDPRAAGREFQQIPVDAVKALDYPMKLPDTEAFKGAVENTKGARITDDGLVIDLERWQHEEQEGAESVRTGVFYVPRGSSAVRHFRNQQTKPGQNSYGGTQQHVGETLLRAPLFVKGSVGGKAPEAAYDAIKGKGAARKMASDVLHEIGGLYLKHMGDIRQELVERLLQKYGADPRLGYDIIHYSRKGNQLRYAIQENIIAHAVREAGYDSVIGYGVGRKGKGEFISEVFDVREDYYPDTGGGYSVHPKFTGGRELNQSGRDTTTVLEALKEGETREAAFERIKAKHPDAKLIPATGDEPGGVQYARAKVRIADLPKSEQPNAWREFNQADKPSLADIRAKSQARVDKYQADIEAGRRVAYDYREGYSVAVTPEPGAPGKYRITTFDKTSGEIVPGGHMVYDSAEAAARGLLPFRELSQGAKGEARRGSIRLEEGRSIITLFKDSDLSTILHEGGHQWLEEFRRDYLDVLSRAPDAAGEMGGHEQLKADFETVMKWLGMESPGEITVEQHEKFARGFEAYFYEGKAPTAALARAFRAFKQWLVRIYRDIAGLNVSMSDDVRGVFDRMLATDDELAAAKDSLGANPAFASAKDAGMTDAEFAGYTAQLEKAQQKADETLLGKTMAAVRAKREKEWKAQFKEMRDEVATVIKSRRDLRAEHWLRTGKMLDGATPEGLEHVRLSQQYLADMYGHKGMIELLPERVTAPKDGAHPDMVATLFGYRNGDELVHDLISLEGMRKAEAAVTGKGMGGDRYVSHLIERETTERMLDRHGDALNDGSIEQEAIDALHNQARIEVLGTELRAIGKRAGKMPVDLADMSEWVDGQISDMPIARAKAETGFLRSEGQAGKETQRALLKGDVRAAFVHKQRQIVNALFVKAARAAGDDYASAMKMFQRYAKKAEHKALDAGYVDQIHALLKRIGFQVKRQDAELAAGIDGATLREFVDGKRADGFELVAAEYLLDPLWNKPVADMTMGELRDVSDLMKSMIHAARFEKQIRLEGKLQEFQAVKDDALATLALRPQLDDPAVKGGVAIRSPERGQRGVKDKARAALFRFKTSLAEIGSNLRKIEELCDILDGDDSGGVFNRVLFRTVADAEHREAGWRREITAKWLKLRDGMGDKWARSLDDARVVVPELRKKTGEAWALSKGELLMIALNTGAKSNLDKMLKGELWEEGNVRAALDRLLTEEDWQFVQSTWDIVNSLWPEIDAMERRLSGVGPDKVEAIPVATKYGTLKGGYFPIMYDRSQSLDTRLKVAAADAHLYDADYQRATTPRGHTKRRVEGYAQPIDYNFGRVANHLESVIHDLSFREVLMQAQRFVSDKEIRAGIVGVIGRENYLQLFPWLKHIANETAIDQRGLTGFDNFVKRVRLNATMVGLGFRVGTMLQQLAGFGDSAEMIGAKGVRDGFRAAYGFGSPLEALSKGIRLVSATKAGKTIGIDYLAKGFDAVTGSQRKFENTRAFVVERSGEVRNRFETIDRDMRQGMKELLGKKGLMTEARRFAYYGIAMMDQAVVVPTWVGAYKKALASGKDEAGAIYYADKVVRLSQGSGAPKDLAAVARSHNKWFDLITMFYSYFSHFQNRLMRIGGQVKAGTRAIKEGNWKQGRKDYAEALARFFWLAVVPPLAAQLITGRGPQEGEDVGGWVMRKLTFNLFGGVPIVRDLASAAEHSIASGMDGEYKFTPAERMGTLSLKVASDAWNATFGDQPVSDKWLKNAIETAGYVGGLPGAGQLGTSSQYLFDISKGERQPEDAAQFMGELLLGPPPKEK